MKRLSVMIADGDREYLMKSTENLRCMNDIDVVLSTMDGMELIKKLNSRKVDIVIMEMMLKRVDGIGVLEAIQRMKEWKPKTMVVSQVASGSIMEAAFSKGVSYYMLKPCDSALLHERIRMIVGNDDEEWPEENEGELRKRIASCMRRIGFVPGVKGYEYLMMAIELRNEDNEKYRHLTDGLYPAIAARAGTSPLSVERSLRTAIQSVWNSGALERFLRNTGQAPFLRGKPTAGQMIDMLTVLVSGKKYRQN